MLVAAYEPPGASCVSTPADAETILAAAQMTERERGTENAPLAVAARHVAQGAERIASLEEHAAQLERSGRPDLAAPVRALLATLRQSLVLSRQHLALAAWLGEFMEEGRTDEQWVHWSLASRPRVFAA